MTAVADAFIPNENDQIAFENSITVPIAQTDMFHINYTDVPWLLPLMRSFRTRRTETSINDPNVV